MDASSFFSCFSSSSSSSFCFTFNFSFSLYFRVLLLSPERFHNCHYFLLRQNNRPVGYTSEQIEWLS